MGCSSSQQFDVEVTDTPADLQDGRAINALGCGEFDDALRRGRQTAAAVPPRLSAREAA